MTVFNLIWIITVFNALTIFACTCATSYVAMNFKRQAKISESLSQGLFEQSSLSTRVARLERLLVEKIEA